MDSPSRRDALALLYQRYYAELVRLAFSLTGDWPRNSPGAQYVVFWAGSAWAVTGTPSGGLVRIDPAANRVSGLAFRLGNDLTYAAPGPGGLWVNDYSTGELLRLAFAS